ncbi:MAG TPA: GAF domain-containing protein, partial [Gaiellaceae bacterium]|nr:GAF domain-containing protein [Gaiellaceae bacterium]
MALFVPLAAAFVGYLLLGLAAAIFAVAITLLAVFRRQARAGSSSTAEAEAGPSATTEVESRPAHAATAEGLDSATSFSTSLSYAAEPQAIARMLLEEVATRLPVQFAALALISDDAKEARGLYAWSDGADVEWWSSLVLDLETESSAIGSAVFEAAPLTIYDVESSPRINRRIADRVGAKSAAFVPLISGDRVIAVLVAATTRQRRPFPGDEITLLESLAAESVLALERT